MIHYPDTSFVSFAYNDAGARTQMVDATGTTAYTYDELYRLTSVTFPGSRTVSYGHDAASRRTSITYPGGSNQETYTYDAANRLTAVTGWDSNSTQYGYDDANRMRHQSDAGWRKHVEWPNHSYSPPQHSQASSQRAMLAGPNSVAGSRILGSR